MQRLVFIVLAIAALAVGLVVGALNADVVTLDLLWVQFGWPLGLIVLASFAAGLVVASTLVYVWAVLPLRMRLRRATPRESAPPAAPPTVPDDSAGA